MKQMFTTTERLFTIVLLMTAMLAAGTVQARAEVKVTFVAKTNYQGVPYLLYQEEDGGTTSHVAILDYEAVNEGKIGYGTLEGTGGEQADFAASFVYKDVTYTLYNNTLALSVTYNPGNAAEPVYKGGLDAGKMADGNLIQYVKIEDGIKAIETNFFKGWNQMTQVDISASVNTIGAQAFQACAKLETVVLDYDGRTVSNTEPLCLGQGAFVNCTALTGVTLPAQRSYVFLHSAQNASPAYMGAQFYGCTALKEIHLTQGVTAKGGRNSFYTLPGYLFGGCTALQKVVFDTYVSAGRIAEHAFDTNRNTGTGKAVSPVPYIQMPFKHTAEPWYADATCLIDTKNGTATLTALGAYQGTTYVVPDNMHLDEYGTDGTNPYAMCGIPNATVTALADGALAGLTAEKICLPKTVAVKVTGDNSDVLGTATFNTAALKRLYFYTEDGVYYYAGTDNDEHFSVLHYNQNADIHTTVNGTQQADDASLAHIYVPDYITLSDLGDAVLAAVPENAFNYNNSIQTVQFVSRSESRAPLTVEKKAFYQMEGLKEVTLAPHVSTIGNSCFGNCKSLEKVVIPDISYNATDGKATLAIYPDAFSHCTSLGVIRLGEGITRISGNAFQSATAASVVLPKTLTSLGSYCFGNLKAVVMQKNADNTEADDLKAKQEMTNALKYGITYNKNAKVYYLTDGTFSQTGLPDAVPVIGYRYGSLSGKGKAGTVYFTQDIDLDNSYNLKGLYNVEELNADKSGVVLTQDGTMGWGGFPYVYFFNDDDVDPNRLTIFAEKTGIAGDSSEDAWGLLKGVKTDTKYADIKGGGYVLQSDGMFHKFSATVDKGLKVPAGRAYIPASALDTSAGAKLSLVFGDDTPTGISTATAGSGSAAQPMYNLAGQRIRSAVKGQIYIQGGKKYLQK